MAETVTMPKLGFDMAEGTLVRWVIAEGENVAKGSVLAEIETDKATVEVESNYEGVLRKQLVEQGAVVPVGTPIAIVGGADEKIEAEPSKEEIAEKDQEGAPGGFTQKEIAEAETGSGGSLKPSAGVVGEVKAKTEEAQPVADLAAKGPAEAKPETAETEAEPGLPDGRRASPLARRMAMERGVDLVQVQGTGPLGRVTRKDIEAFLEKGPAPAEQAAAPAAAPAPAKAATLPAPIFSPVGPPPPDERVPLNRLRAAIGRRMVEAKQQVPHFYVTHEYDMAPIIDLRKEINTLLPEDQKVSVNDFIIKATALALRAFPNLNASIQGNEIVRHGAVNIGVAVAVEGGLLTVVCRDADRKPLRQIAVEVRTMAGRARGGKVRPDEIEGSTLSISNLGMYDVDEFIAIINPPEAAILAVGSAKEIPVVKDGQVVPGMRMKATISVDHRVSDGAEAARFMQALAPYLEEPLRLLL